MILRVGLKKRRRLNGFSTLYTFYFLLKCTIEIAPAQPRRESGLEPALCDEFIQQRFEFRVERLVGMIEPACGSDDSGPGCRKFSALPFESPLDASIGMALVSLPTA